MQNTAAAEVPMACSGSVPVVWTLDSGGGSQERPGCKTLTLAEKRPSDSDICHGGFTADSDTTFTTLLEMVSRDSLIAYYSIIQ